MPFRRSSSPELLDDRAHRNLSELRENLCDMARYDRWLGAFRLTLRLATESLNPFSSFTGLDIGLGSADFIRYAQCHAPIRIQWMGLDRSREVLRLVRETDSISALTLLCAEGERLPFADDSIDIITCAHTLHHLEPPQAIALLRECAAKARLRVVVVDLVRSYATLVGARLLTRLTSRNRMTRADGVQSARRAYTLSEVKVLARSAGLDEARVQAHGPTRLSITWCKCETGKIAT